MPSIPSASNCGLTARTPEESATWASQCGDQFPEQRWLASRFQEASEAWRPLVVSTVIVVLREVLGGSATDEEVTASLKGVPQWLAAGNEPA
jgi:hypothetical protein